MIILISAHVLFNHSLGQAPSEGNHIQGPSSHLCNFYMALSHPTHCWLPVELVQVCSSSRHHTIKLAFSAIEVKMILLPCYGQRWRVYVCSPGARTLSSALHEMKWQMHILCLGISALDFCLDISFCKSTEKQCATQQVEQIYMSANACHSKGITFIVRKKPKKQPGQIEKIGKS